MTHAEGAERLPLPVVAGAIFLAAWTSVMLPGFAFPEGNNIFHVPTVLDFAGSAEGPHDAFTNSLDNFVSGVWPVLSLVATERNVFWLFFAAHVASRILFAAGLYALIRHFGARQIAALAMVALAGLAPVFKMESTVGRNEMLAYYFTHTELAVALLPGIWWLLVSGRWIIGAAVIGLMFNINAFLSIWTTVAALIAFAATRPASPAWRQLLLCGAVLAVTALPTAIWTLRTVMQPAPEIDFRAYLLSYYPFHTFIHVQWDAAARYSAYLIAAVLAVRIALRELDSPGAKVIAALLVGYGLIFLAGIPLPYLTGWSLLLNLYPLRLDAALNIGIAAMLLAWAARRWSDERETLPLAIGFAMLCGNAIAALLLLGPLGTRSPGKTVLIAALAAALALLIVTASPPELGRNFTPMILAFGAAALAAAFHRDERGNAPVDIAVVTAALVCSVLPLTPGFPWPVLGLAIAVAAYSSRPRWFGLLGFASAVYTCVWIASTGDRLSLLAALALTVFGVLLALPRAGLVRRIAAWCVAPAGLLSGVAALGLALSGYAAWRGTVERPGHDLSEERQAQQWIRRNTPADTRLLVVGLDGFGLMARRPVWVEWKTGAAVMWQPSYLFEWRPRMKELERCSETTCYAALARRHGLGWIVAAPQRMAEPDAAGLRLRFRNEGVEVYSVHGAPRGPDGGQGDM